MKLRLWKSVTIWTNKQTLFAAIWRFLVAVFDWRTILRKIKGQPVVDTVFVTNMRDETDRRNYLGLWHPKKGHFNGPRYWISGVAGRTRAIDITTEEFITLEGRKKAKKYFISATRWAKDNGAKVILLAARTKRLFGKDADQLKKLFPDLIFTIGDNGTFLLLEKEVFIALKSANLKPGYCRVGIIGPYGHLGEMMVIALKKEGYDIIGAGHSALALESIKRKHGINTCRTFDEMGKVDAVVTCTNNEKFLLNAENIELVRYSDRKLLVIDVAEPSNFTQSKYLKCKDKVIRQDAGNAYSSNLKYVLGPISYKMFRLTKGVTFGCFAESLSITSEIKQGNNIGEINWLTVSASKMKAVARMFKQNAFILPSPRCFGELVKSFDLTIQQSREKNQIKIVKFQRTNLQYLKLIMKHRC